LTITQVGNAFGGSVKISGGQVVFTPDPDFNGTASFDYTVQDDGTTAGANDFRTDVGTVRITVTEANDAPVAADDPLTSIAEDSGDRIIPFSALLGNDRRGPSNESGQTLSILGAANFVGGSISFQGTNVVFTPAPDFNGTASFTYFVIDDGTTNGS